MTEWMHCTAWGKLAETAGQYAHKGSRLYVQGRLQTSRWAGDERGAPRSRVEILLDDLILLDRPMPVVEVENERDVGETQPIAHRLIASILEDDEPLPEAAALQEGPRLAA